MSEARVPGVVGPYPQQENYRPVTPELDERLWLAWKDKNQAKDLMYARRRKRVVALLMVVVIVGLTLAYYAGVI